MRRSTSWCRSAQSGRSNQNLGNVRTPATTRITSPTTWSASRVPLLPCYLYGTTRGQVGPPRLIVGEELSPEGDAETLTDRLRRAILALQPAAAIAAAEAS